MYPCINVLMDNGDLDPTTPLSESPQLVSFRAQPSLRLEIRGAAGQPVIDLRMEDNGMFFIKVSTHKYPKGALTLQSNLPQDAVIVTHTNGSHTCLEM